MPERRAESKEGSDAGAAAPCDRRRPWSSTLCFVYSILASLLLGVAYLGTPAAPREGTADVSVMWHSQSAMFLIVSAMLSEMCLLLSCSADEKYAGRELSEKMDLRGVGDSALTLAEYTFKMVTALYVSNCGGGVMHVDQLAFGGPRTVYVARYAQWSMAVPLFMYIGSRVLLHRMPQHMIVSRCMPAMAAAFLYCWCSWVMQVTTSAPLRVALFAFSFIGPALVGTDQVVMALEHYDDDLFAWKMGVVLYQIAVMSAYGVVFAVARCGVLGSTAEQLVYSYADSSICILQGALLSAIRNREALLKTRHWCIAAETAKEDLENLINRANVPVLSLDMDGRITMWNASLEKLTGRSSASVMGMPLKDIACADSHDGMDAAMGATIRACEEAEREGGKARRHIVATSKSNSTFAEIAIPLAKALPNGTITRRLAMSFVPNQSDEGALAGVTAIGQDLSEIAELRIIQDRKSALMALLSHELRSPLHGMLGLTDSLLNSPAGKTMSKQLGMVRGCAARLLDLVANIMDLAHAEKQRQDNGGANPRPESPVDFGAIVEEVHAMTLRAVDKVNRPLLKPSVRLVNNLCDQRVPIIRGDMHKCTQLLYNLVTNACKFTERGSVSMSHRFVKETQRLEIDITDTGRGISEDGQKRIFQAFEQEQNGDTRNFQGIGLGLAVCTDICELHGGELRLASQLGHGSTFTISFPCDESLGYGEVHTGALMEPAVPEASPPPAPARSAAPVDQDSVPPPENTAERALVLSVDDDPVNQEVVKGALSAYCDIHCAMDGVQALRFLREQGAAKKKMPDVVLLDIQMPGMDGFEVCQEIRKGFAAAHANLPIIMLSARAPADETAIQGYNSGATDFVPKPFSAEVIRRKVEVILSISKRAALGSSMNLIMEKAEERVKMAKDAAAATSNDKRALEEQLSSLRAELDGMREQHQKYQEEQSKLFAEVGKIHLNDTLSSKEQGRTQVEAAERKAQVAEEKAEAFQSELRRLQRELQDVQASSLRERQAADERASGKMLPLLEHNLESSRLIQEQKKQLVANSTEILCANAVLSAVSSRIGAVDKVSRGCRSLLELPRSCNGLGLDSQFKVAEAPKMPDELSRHQLELELRAYREVSHVVSSQLLVLENIIEQPFDWMNRLGCQVANLPIKFEKGSSTATTSECWVDIARSTDPSW